ncbi:MAG: dTMP kinase [Termitinemataceae bacterium]|nr:MAG: dTMP kinase [Termitinemataceae bacterium]
MTIAIDGIDGAGKGTQCRLLSRYFEASGRRVHIVSFPVYSSFFGMMISDYLNGSYGSLYAINPKLTALLYAMDRRFFFENNSFNSSDIIIFDRYVLSNMAHQGVKFEPELRESFFSWIKELEFNINKIPRPDISFVLDIDAKISARNVAKKEKRAYTDKTHDIHEGDSVYLANTRTLFIELAAQTGAHIVYCSKDEVLRSEEEIAEEINFKISEYCKSFKSDLV